MGFNGQKAVAWKERFLEAFNAMEAALLRQQRQREAARFRQRQWQETNPKELEQPPRLWEKPESFRSARKLTKAQMESLLGVLNMECLLQNRQPEDALKELLTFFHLSSLEDIRQSDYRHAVFSVMKRMLLISGKTSGWKSSAQEQRFSKLDKDKFSQLLGFTPTGNGLSNSQLEKLRTSIDCTCNDDELNSFARLSIIKRDSASPILATSANAHLGYGTVIKCDGQYYL